MNDEHGDEIRRRLPLVEQEPRMAASRYSPEVLAGLALGEAAALESIVARDAAGVVEAATIATNRAEQLIETAMQHEPPQNPIACGPGCSTCCQAKVLVVAPEIIRVAEYLRKHRTPDELQILLEKVRLADSKTRGLSREARAGAHIFCPLLNAEGACSIHEVRPLVCRSWTSYDARACVDYWQSPQGRLTPPQWPVGYELAQAMLAGLGRACIDRGFDGTPLELIAALRIVLERPNAVERWLKKLPVFSQARDAEWAERNARV